mgnify:CR=1 FL=1
MAIIKTKIREKSYMQIDKTGIEDNRITLSATGLLCYLIGRPSNWDIIIEHLRTVKRDGRDSVKSALVELREYEYCHYFELREKGVVRETFYLVFEIPTPYEEVMREYIEIPDGYTLLYKPVSKKRKEIIMEEKKPTFITINKNKEKIKEKQYAYDELDLIKILFEMYNINFTDENIKELQFFLTGLSQKNKELEKENIETDKNTLKPYISPKTEIQLSAKKEQKEDNTFKSEVYPKTASPLTANRSLIIIDNKKIDIKNHDNQEEKKADLDFFENLFKEFKINFTKTNQESVKKLLVSLSSQKKVEEYLRETFENIKKTPSVKDPARLFSSKIAKGERQVVPKANIKKIMDSNLDQETENEEILIKQEKVLKTELNYLLGYVKNNFKTPIEAYQDMVNFTKKKEYNSILIEKYLLKMKDCLSL